MSLKEAQAGQAKGQPSGRACIRRRLGADLRVEVGADAHLISLADKWRAFGG